MDASRSRMSVRLQHFFKRGERRTIFRELPLKRGARGTHEIRYRFLVLGNDAFGILTTPIDHAGIALAHRDAYIHRGPIDEAANAAGFLARLLDLTAQVFALEIQLVRIAPARDLLPVEELHEFLFAYIGAGPAIALGTIHADLDEVIEGFKVGHGVILLSIAKRPCAYETASRKRRTRIDGRKISRNGSRIAGHFADYARSQLSEWR
jgi:hypothetical protein